MSAQQREALSRGQMSTTTGSPSPSGPRPDSWPAAPWAPGRRSRRRAARSRAPRRRPASPRGPPRRWCRRARIMLRGDAPSRRRRRVWARRMPSSWAPRLARGGARRSARASSDELDPAGAQVVGDARAGTSSGTQRALDAELAAGAQRELVLDLVAGQALRRAARRGRARTASRISMPSARDLVGVEHADRGDAAAAGLDVE